MSPRTPLVTARRRRPAPWSWAALALLGLVSAGCGQPIADPALESLLSSSAGCGRPAPPADSDGRVVATIPSSGGVREYLVVVPPGYSPDRPAPVAFMFHGAGSSKELQLEYSQFGPVAAAGGGLLVLPDALGEPRRWSPFGPQVFGVVGVDDLVFFDDVLRRVSQEFCIDPRRVLATGMSSGGFMAAAVGCQRSGRVAAVGAVTATMWVDELCGRAAPVAYAQFHGTADEVVPYDGGLGTGGVTFGPIEVSAQSWADQNGCSGEPDDQPVGREVVKRTWSGCDASTALFIVGEGGHTWPGAVIASDVGHTTHDVDASTIIWDVFEASWPSAPPNAPG